MKGAGLHISPLTLGSKNKSEVEKSVVTRVMNEVSKGESKVNKVLGVWCGWEALYWVRIFIVVFYFFREKLEEPK